MIRTPRQSGAALALVLLIMAIAATLGLSYLSSVTISLAASDGFQDAARARYVAESGVQHAICLLRENPDMLTASVGSVLGPYHVDSEASYTFAVTPVGVPGYFTITSEATCGRSRQSAAVTVFHSEGSKDPIEQAAMVGGGAGFVSGNVRVIGNVHGNGNVIVEGTIEGDVSAVGAVANMGFITGSVQGNSSVVITPDLAPADYQRYLYGDRQGEAITITRNRIIEHDAIDDGRAETGTNPAGVVIARPTGGSLWLCENLNIVGTLVVHGDLVLDGWNMRLRSRPSFPALVVTGQVYLTQYSVGVRVDGVVYAAGGVVNLGTVDHTDVVFAGAVQTDVTGFDRALVGSIVVEHNSDATTLLDPRGWGTGGAVEILSWDR